MKLWYAIRVMKDVQRNTIQDVDILLLAREEQRLSGRIKISPPIDLRTDEEQFIFNLIHSNTQHYTIIILYLYILNCRGF